MLSRQRLSKDTWRQFPAIGTWTIAACWLAFSGCYDPKSDLDDDQSAAPDISPSVTPGLSPTPEISPTSAESPSPDMELTPTPNDSPTPPQEPTPAATSTPDVTASPSTSLLPESPKPSLEPSPPEGSPTPAEPTIEPTPDTSPLGTPEASPTTAPEPSVEPSFPPSPDPTSVPTLEPSPDVSLEPSPDASLEPTAEPSLEPSADPSLEPSPDASLEPTAEPSLEPSPEPICPECPIGEVWDSVEVLFDSFGIPHIYASSDHDLFFTQGYLLAKDRLLQLDLTRRQALGYESELFGSEKLSSDMIVRSFQPLKRAEENLAMWEKDGTRDREIAWAEAFAAGVNAYIDDAVAGRNGATLPETCLSLGYVPEYLTTVQMTAMDIILALTMGPDPLIELTATLIGLLVGDDVLNDVLWTQPVSDAYTVVDAQSPIENVTDENMTASARSVKKWRAGIRRFDSRLQQHLESILRNADSVQQIREAIATIQKIEVWNHRLGSNAWVVSGSRTESGWPLLADDTHTALSLPDLYNQIHLNTYDAGGDLNVIGAAAGGPAVILGHNGHVGWGTTTSFFDVSDLYLEVAVPIPGYSEGGVLFNDEAVPYEVWDETFKIRQEDGSIQEETYTLKRVPHHGPVLPNEALGLPESMVISFKWAGEQPGATIATIYRFVHSRSIDDIEAAMEQHRIGAANFVFATINGDIAYDPRVALPIRSNNELENPPWLGLSGTGDYEWTDEWIPAEDIPHVVNPEAGFAVTANNDPSGNTSDNNPLNEQWYFGALFDSGMRAQRIDSVLRDRFLAGDLVNAEDMSELQADVYDVLAERLIPYLLDAADRDSNRINAQIERDALAALASWNFELDEDAIAGTIFTTWWPIAMQEIFEDETDPALFELVSGEVAQYYSRPLVHFLDLTRDIIDGIDDGTVEFPSSSGINYFDDQQTPRIETRDEQLLDGFESALEHLSTVLGNDITQWEWQDLHVLTLVSPSSAWLDGFDRGPFPLDGGSFTVDVGDGILYEEGAPVEKYEVTNGPSLRMVLDFAGGAISASATIPGGQSERKDSEHYDDQVPYWLDNVAIPLPYHRSEVEADARSVWILPPGYPEVERIEEN